MWGLAIVRQWRCVLSAASTQDMLALMRASGDTHRRRQGQRFLEHEIVAAAAIAGGPPIAGCQLELLPRIAGDEMLEQLRAGQVRMRVTRGPSCGGVREVNAEPCRRPHGHRQHAG